MLTTASWLQQRWQAAQHAREHQPVGVGETVRTLAARLAVAPASNPLTLPRAPSDPASAAAVVADQAAEDDTADRSATDVRDTLRALKSIARDQPSVVAAEAWASLLDALAVLAYPNPPPPDPATLFSSAQPHSLSGSQHGQDLARERALQYARVRRVRRAARERARAESLVSLIDTVTELCDKPLNTDEAEPSSSNQEKLTDPTARAEAFLVDPAQLARVLSLLGPGVHVPLRSGTEQSSTTTHLAQASKDVPSPDLLYPSSLALACLRLLRALVRSAPERTGAVLLGIQGGMAVILRWISPDEASWEPDENEEELSGVKARAALRAEALLVLPSLVAHSAPLAQLALYEGALEALLAWLVARSQARSPSGRPDGSSAEILRRRRHTQSDLPVEPDIDALEACEALLSRAPGASSYFIQERLGDQLCFLLGFPSPRENSQSKRQGDGERHLQGESQGAGENKGEDQGKPQASAQDLHEGSFSPQGCDKLAQAERQFDLLPWMSTRIRIAQAVMHLLKALLFPSPVSASEEPRNIIPNPTSTVTESMSEGEPVRLATEGSDNVELMARTESRDHADDGKSTSTSTSQTIPKADFTVQIHLTETRLTRWLAHLVLSHEAPITLRTQAASILASVVRGCIEAQKDVFSARVTSQTILDRPSTPNTTRGHSAGMTSPPEQHSQPASAITASSFQSAHGAQILAHEHSRPVGAFGQPQIPATSALLSLLLDWGLDGVDSLTHVQAKEGEDIGFRGERELYITLWKLLDALVGGNLSARRAVLVAGVEGPAYSQPSASPPASVAIETTDTQPEEPSSLPRVAAQGSGPSTRQSISHTTGAENPHEAPSPAPSGAVALDSKPEQNLELKREPKQEETQHSFGEKCAPDADFDAEVDAEDEAVQILMSRKKMDEHFLRLARPCGALWSAWASVLQQTSSGNPSKVEGGKDTTSANDDTRAARASDIVAFLLQGSQEVKSAAARAKICSPSAHLAAPLTPFSCDKSGEDETEKSQNIPLLSLFTRLLQPDVTSYAKTQLGVLKLFAQWAWDWDTEGQEGHLGGFVSYAPNPHDFLQALARPLQSYCSAPGPAPTHDQASGVPDLHAHRALETSVADVPEQMESHSRSALAALSALVLVIIAVFLPASAEAETYLNRITQLAQERPASLLHKAPGTGTTAGQDDYEKDPKSQQEKRFPSPSQPWDPTALVHLVRVSYTLGDHPSFTRVRPPSGGDGSGRIALPSSGPLPSYLAYSLGFNLVHEMNEFSLQSAPVDKSSSAWMGEWFNWPFVLWWHGALRTSHSYLFQARLIVFKLMLIFE